MKPVSEDDLINEDGDQFDLTHINVSGEENKNAMINEAQRPSEAEGETPVPEENR